MDEACAFCDSSKAVLRNRLAYAIYDANPVTPGHMLIIPVRHVADYFDLSIVEKEAMLHISNVAHIDPKSDKPTRVGFKTLDGRKVRFARKSGEVLDA